MASPAEESTHWLKGILTIAILVGLGILLAFPLLYGQQRRQASINDCRASNAPAKPHRPCAPSCRPSICAI